jgi:hypothetical protein
MSAANQMWGLMKAVDEGRCYGLDALRGSLMMLEIVLHAASYVIGSISGFKPSASSA